jgi:hypothetical protein
MNRGTADVTLNHKKEEDATKEDVTTALNALAEMTGAIVVAEKEEATNFQGSFLHSERKTELTNVRLLTWLMSICQIKVLK